MIMYLIVLTSASTSLILKPINTYKILLLMQLTKNVTNESSLNVLKETYEKEFH